MNARLYCLKTLQRVFQEGAYASILLRHADVDKKDIDFVSEIVYGTIRNYQLLEFQWRKYANATNQKNSLLLDMTIYQMFFMDSVPDYAAIHEAVELAKESDKSFINAILRKVQAEGLQSSDDLSIQYSHPKWMIDLWNAHYGEEITQKILEENQKPSRVYGRINTLKCKKEDFDASFHFLNDICFISENNIVKMEEFKEGKIVIQDYHAQMVVDALDVKEDMNVLDLCAAPGTKTQQIAMYMNNKGHIIAGDYLENRLELINSLMDRCGATIVETILNDATINHFEEESFDRILMDVPCSGMGDLSHKPEIRYSLKPEDIDNLIAIQEKILDANANALKKGGILVYSTCTLNKKENEKQVEKFLKKNSQFELLEETTLFPFEDHSDGFYYAKLKRKQS